MKKRMTKLIAMSLAATLSIGMLTGCGSDKKGNKDPEPEKKEAKEVTFWHYWENEADLLKEMCEEYNATQDEIEVVPTFVAREELMKQYTIGAVSGDLPDIGLVDSPDMASYIALGVFEDITDELGDWGELDQFYNGPLSSCKDADGKIYGIPNNTNCLSILCNMDMLKAAGFQEPPKTWSEFKEVCKKTSDAANGVYGFSMSAIGNEEGTFQYIPWLYGAGASVQNVDSEEGIQSFALLSDLVQNGWMSKEVANWNQGDALNAWVAGKAAMVESGPWQINQLDGEFKDTVTWEYAYTPVPANDNGAQATVIGGENFGVCAGSEYKKECVDFLKWMHSKEKNADWCERSGKLPVRGDSAESRDIWNKDARFKVFTDSMEFAVARGPHESWPNISEALYTAEQAVLLGEKDAQTAAKDAAAAIKPILDEKPILEQ